MASFVGGWGSSFTFGMLNQRVRVCVVRVRVVCVWGGVIFTVTSEGGATCTASIIKMKIIRDRLRFVCRAAN